MSNSFYDELKKDKLFKESTREMKLVKRDYHVIALVCAAAERMLGEAKQIIAEKEGQLETERTKTKAALLLGLNKQNVKTSLLALITPIDEIPKLSWNEASSGNELKAKHKEPEALPDNKTNTSDSSTKESTTSDDVEAIKELPFYLRWPAFVLRNTVARMPPLVIAAWAVILVSAAVVYAERSVASVQETYDRAIKQRDDFKKELEEKGTEIKTLKAQIEGIPSLRTQIDSLENEIGSMRGTIAEKTALLEKERSEADEERRKLVEKHQKRIDDFTKSSTDAMQKMVSSVQSQNETLTSENQRLSRQVKDLEISLDSANSRSGDATSQLKTTREESDRLRQDLRDERRKVSEVQRDLDEFESMVPFVRDLTRSIDHYFYRRAYLQLHERRDCFRNNYKRLYLGSKRVLEANIISDDMNLAENQTILQRTIDRCNSELR